MEHLVDNIFEPAASFQEPADPTNFGKEDDDDPITLFPRPRDLGIDFVFHEHLRIRLEKRVDEEQENSDEKGVDDKKFLDDEKSSTTKFTILPYFGDRRVIAMRCEIMLGFHRPACCGLVQHIQCTSPSWLGRLQCASLRLLHEEWPKHLAALVDRLLASSLLRFE
jgi:hypothetical protein